MGAFYNEIDPLAAQTIREAIARDLIAPGVVDERDIRDIRPIDLAGYTQVHLFAGGGIWSYALRRAGWSDDRPVWTCSCPCQPFSQAGKGGGFADERHLWPAAEWLIRQCEPECILGEQVADKGADPWVDLVQADLEALGYAFGIVPLASAGFGAPNIRHRSFWVAYALGLGCQGIGGRRQDGASEYGDSGGLADPNNTEWRQDGAGGHDCGGQDARWAQSPSDLGKRDGALRLADSALLGHEWGGPARQRGDGPSDQRNLDCVACGGTGRIGPYFPGGISARCANCGGVGLPGPTNGFWGDADWLLCRDPRGPRWRPVDAGTFPLAPGHPARVGGLRISGNAINAEVATAFIEAVIDSIPSFTPTDAPVRAPAGSLPRPAGGLCSSFHSSEVSDG